MMVTEALTIKGDKSGLKLLINATFTKDEILDSLDTKITDNLSFFKNSEVIISSNTIEKIDYDFYKEIKDKLENQLNLKVKSTFKSYVGQATTNKIENLKTEFVFGSMRSGQFIEVPSHIVITGDVNAGSKVYAGGNIIVMGTIRGTVHAGYSGNRSAIIACTKFRAPQAQIRIADLIVFKNNEGLTNKENLEIAQIENDEIVLLSRDNKF